MIMIIFDIIINPTSTIMILIIITIITTSTLFPIIITLIKAETTTKPHRSYTINTASSNEDIKRSAIQHGANIDLAMSHFHDVKYSCRCLIPHTFGAVHVQLGDTAFVLLSCNRARLCTRAGVRRFLVHDKTHTRLCVHFYPVRFYFFFLSFFFFFSISFCFLFHVFIIFSLKKEFFSFIILLWLIYDSKKMRVDIYMNEKKVLKKGKNKGDDEEEETR